jgi:hypothetical protein
MMHTSKRTHSRSFFPIVFVAVAILTSSPAFAVDLRVGTFNVDATPPVGSVLGGGSVPPMRGVDDPLSARGIVLLPEGQEPVVLCAIDWIGIGNEGHKAYRAVLAEAVGTSIHRVAVHTLHQHDAPFFDLTVEVLMQEHDLGERMFDIPFAVEVGNRLGSAVKIAVDEAKPVTHFGLGKAKVEKVASNRRILGEDGRVKHVRYTACADPEVRAYPEGTIDPWLRAVSFWNGDEPVAILTHYATHPQSFYRTGMVSVDFPGLARAAREEEIPGAAHIHFNGAGGNIGAGKYNDGDPKNRPVLTERMRDGMQRAFEATERVALADVEFDWAVHGVVLPTRTEIDLEEEREVLADPDAELSRRMRAAREIAWIERHEEDPIVLGRLRLGELQILYMPGELFVEYQLAAQAMAPDDFVAMAAYGDYAPGYIGTAVAYPQGGYETGLHTSRTAPAVEGVLMDAMKSLLRR